MSEDIHDAIMVELGRRLYEPPIPITCSCGGHDMIYHQMCDCEAEPDFATWKCSNCGTPYERLDK